MRKKMMVRVLMVALLGGFVASCASKKACCSTNQEWESSRWKIVSMSGHDLTAVKEADSFTLGFDKKEGRVFGVAVCNRFFGSYEVKEKGVLDIKMGGSTRMACPQMDLEQPYFNMLDEADQVKVKKDQLILYKEKKEIATFRKVAVAE